jgi:hypothetical protein
MDQVTGNLCKETNASTVGLSWHRVSQQCDSGLDDVETESSDVASICIGHAPAYIMDAIMFLCTGVHLRYTLCMLSLIDRGSGDACPHTYSFYYVARLGAGMVDRIIRRECMCCIVL